MDPAIFNEAEEARLSQCVSDARKSLGESANRLARQRELVEKLECNGHPTLAAKQQLAALAAAHRLVENLYN
jgi:hypothetical protein